MIFFLLFIKYCKMSLKYYSVFSNNRQHTDSYYVLNVAFEIENTKSIIDAVIVRVNYFQKEVKPAYLLNDDKNIYYTAIELHGYSHESITLEIETIYRSTQSEKKQYHLDREDFMKLYDIEQYTHFELIKAKKHNLFQIFSAIKNIKFNQVKIIYTLDDWNSSNEIVVSSKPYYKVSNTNFKTDLDHAFFKYSFLASCDISKIIYCLCYTDPENNEIWDNNDGNNYTIQFY